MSCKKTIAVNSENAAVTEYTNYGFNSFCLFNGKYLGAKDDGIFELTGADDDGTAINGSFQTATIDAERGQERRLRDFWIVGRKGNMLLTVIVEESKEYDYNAPVENGSIHEERVKTGRGIKGRSFSFKITNVDGTDFDIDSIRGIVEPLRRVR
jgi:hypothetical protein